MNTGSDHEAGSFRPGDFVSSRRWSTVARTRGSTTPSYRRSTQIVAALDLPLIG